MYGGSEVWKKNHQGFFKVKLCDNVDTSIVVYVYNCFVVCVNKSVKSKNNRSSGEYDNENPMPLNLQPDNVIKGNTFTNTSYCYIVRKKPYTK